MQVVLVMFRSDGERRSFSVVRNMTVIGRREDCDLRIPVGEVSRKHCRLVLTDDGVRIEDLGSSNGTWVNRQRVQESDLSAGDVITVGPVQFVVQLNGVPDDQSLTAPAPLNAPVDEDDSMMGFDSPTIPQRTAPNSMTVDRAPGDIDDSGEFEISDISPPPAPVASAVEDSEFALADEGNKGAIPLDDDFSFEDGPTAPLPEADLPGDAAGDVGGDVGGGEDDLTLPDFPTKPAVAAEDEFEIPDLDAAAETPKPEAKKPAGDAGDSDWDFEIEETDAATPGEFDIDLDSSHQQPHGS